MSCDRQPNSVGETYTAANSQQGKEEKKRKKCEEIFVVRLSLPSSNNKLEVRFYIQQDAVFSCSRVCLLTHFV